MLRLVHSASKVTTQEIATEDHATAASYCWRSDEFLADSFRTSTHIGHHRCWRYIRVLETLRRDHAAGREALQCSLLVREERATPTADRMSQLLAGTVGHEPALTARILAYCGIDLKHCPSDILNIAPPFVQYGPSGIFSSQGAAQAPDWWRVVERLPYEDRVDHAAFRAHYGHAMCVHPRLFVSSR